MIQIYPTDHLPYTYSYLLYRALEIELNSSSSAPITPDLTRTLSFQPYQSQAAIETIVTSLELLLGSSEERLGVLQTLGEEVPVGGSKGGGEVEKEAVSGERVISYAWSLLKRYESI